MKNGREIFLEVVGFVEIWLRSEAAMLIYSWMAIVLIFLAAAMISARLLRVIRDFSGKDLLRTQRGRKPVRQAAIDKRIKRLKMSASSKSKTIVGHAFGLFMVGIVVPGVLLALIAARQDWLMPGIPALVFDGAAVASGGFSYFDIALFVTDQALRGGLSDSFEVFGWALTEVQNNPNNVLYSSLTLFYRFLSGAVLAAILFVSIRIFSGAQQLNDKIQMLEEKQAASS